MNDPLRKYLTGLAITAEDRNRVAAFIGRQPDVWVAFNEYMVAQHGEKAAWDLHRAIDGWMAGSSLPGAMWMQGALVALGLPGTLPQGEHAPVLFKEHFDRGLQDLQMQRIVRDVYLVAQAILQLRGIKEMHLFRGFRMTWEYADSQNVTRRVVDEYGDLVRVTVNVGAVISLPTRVISSWTTSQGVAVKFARMHEVDAGPVVVVVEARIPAAAIFLTPEMLGGDDYHAREAEFVVLGSRKARLV